jgi:hypothetical protein
VKEVTRLTTAIAEKPTTASTTHDPIELRPRSARVGRLHAAMAAALEALLTELAGFDDDEIWRDEGSTDMVSWLTWELGVSRRTARAWLQVARCLDDLPELRRRLASGELSIDQVKPLTEIATPDTEAELADHAMNMTAAEIARMVRKAKEIPREQAITDEGHCSVSWWWDADESFLNLKGRLPRTEGALVEHALLRLAHEEVENVGPEHIRAMDERAADALAAMASQALGAIGDPERAGIVVHIDAAALASVTGTAVIEDGPVIGIDTALRLACDAHLRVVVEGPDGSPIGIGRRSRSIPRWLTRLVMERDEGCRFPGCSRTRWIHSHHIVHWAHGGSTDLGNLITLCGFHHRKLHDEGWQILGSPDGEVRWRSPHGWILEPARTLGTIHPIRRTHADIDEMFERRIRGPD